MKARVAATLFLAIATMSCERATEPVALVYADRAVDVAPASKGWTSVSVGGSHSCGIRIGGALYCWGSNASGQLGVGVARGHCGRRASECEAAPRAVAGSEKFALVSAGQQHTCAIATSGTLYCWGENVEFQAGIQGVPFQTTPVALSPGVQWIDVGAGFTHTCAVRTNGVVYCWGQGQLGALGRGDSTSSVLPAPVAASQRFVQVRSGRLRSCGIAVDARAWCWGSEWESSDGSFDYFHPRLLPHPIDGLPQLRDISVSALSICTAGLDGIARCFEGNSFAQLGTGSLAGTTIPTAAATSERFVSVSAGVIQTCGTSDTGRVFCWGNNSFGQLGVPRPGEYCGPASLECSRVPIATFGMQRFVAVATGAGNHACGVSTDTAILCWGLGGDGQLGDGFTRDRQSLPVGVLAPVP